MSLRQRIHSARSAEEAKGKQKKRRRMSQISPRYAPSMSMIPRKCHSHNLGLADSGKERQP
ncbi:hypothetical protein CGCF415_v005604 [Colletotrichum fructicola]|nr:hypothetical protein CGCFRS4_v007685 [Colletotrichum fructicola]KAF4909913.1 hypothetical protein CGCF415_v005604 [Colletotrichum fructicola]KAF4933901.1 hypothetical protein CGCF245_v009140 [Colletotrichum fructicola]